MWNTLLPALYVVFLHLNFGLDIQEQKQGNNRPPMKVGWVRDVGLGLSRGSMRVTFVPPSCRRVPSEREIGMKNQDPGEKTVKSKTG